MNAMCYDCLLLSKECNGTKESAWTGCVYKKKDESKAQMTYCEKNSYWNSNSKIRARFTRLSYTTGNYIYVGLLKPDTWTCQDYIDVMSYYDCIGFMRVTEKEARENSSLPTGNYSVFLKLERKPARK